MIGKFLLYKYEKYRSDQVVGRDRLLGPLTYVKKKMF